MYLFFNTAWSMCPMFMRPLMWDINVAWYILKILNAMGLYATLLSKSQMP